MGAPPAPSSEPLELKWEAPEGCPAAGEARGRVTRFLGREPGLPGDPRVRAHVRITRRNALFVAELDLASDDGSGQRRFEAERCEVVADAAAYMVAAMIDPSVEPPEPEPAAEPELAPEPEPEVEVETEPEPVVLAPAPEPRASSSEGAAAPRTASRSRGRIGGALRIGPAVGVGQLPSVAAGIVGGVAVLLPRLRLELVATHWLARPARLDDRPEIGGDIRLTTGAVRVCPLVLLRPIEIPLCGGFEAGSMHGRGVGVAEPATTRLPWAAFTAGAGLVWMPARWVGMWLDMALVVPVSRPVFVVENVGRVHQPAAAAFAGVLGVEVRFF
jgi:hypothetical protein